jgi:hypothetical protein
MVAIIGVNCRDYGTEGCQKYPDPKYTMDFSDIREKPIYWCSVCGPVAHAMNRMIEEALSQGGLPMFNKLEEAIRRAEKKSANSKMV